MTEFLVHQGGWYGILRVNQKPGRNKGRIEICILDSLMSDSSI